VNAFTDVQTSPEGDVYAVQHLKPEGGDEKYYLYFLSVEDNKWNIFRNGLQAKLARFDIFGNMYYLGVNNCIYQNIDDT